MFPIFISDKPSMCLQFAYMDCLPYNLVFTFPTPLSVYFTLVPSSTLVYKYFYVLNVQETSYFC